jgi:hypothetical protein
MARPIFRSTQIREPRIRFADAVARSRVKHESLTFEVLETGRVGDAHQMAGAKDGFAVAERIGGMNVALDYVVVHQTIST